MQNRNGRLLAVSSDPPSHAFQVVQRLDLEFPVLADTDLRAIRDYGVVHAGGGPNGEDIALPAMFLIDQNGRILWQRIARRIQDRPAPDAVLAEIRSRSR